MKDTGGPAFPVESSAAQAWAVFENAHKPISEEDYMKLLDMLRAGMTLRDYFAAKAMQGVLAGDRESGHLGEAVFETVARASYRFADAMLKERAK